MTTPKKPSGLGRGLSALLGDAPAPASSEPVAAGAPGTRTLPIELIIANPKQPRRRFEEGALADLEASIREKGILQPLLVRPSVTQPGLFEIVAGERRWRASQRVPLYALPVVVRDLNDSEVLEIALVENIQRQDLNPIEEAEGYQRLIAEFAHTQETLAKIVGKSRSHVANLLRLLELTPGVRTLLVEGKLTMCHARALVTAVDPDVLAARVVADGLSVRQTEVLGQAARRPDARPGRPGPMEYKSAAKNPDSMAMERDLAAALGMKVDLTLNGPGGVLTITFTSLDDLDELAQRLSLPASDRGGI
jgi:ParB family transcriptional regulator, chromosome partitioning protein